MQNIVLYSNPRRMEVKHSSRRSPADNSLCLKANPLHPLPLLATNPVPLASPPTGKQASKQEDRWKKPQHISYLCHSKTSLPTRYYLVPLVMQNVHEAVRLILTDQFGDIGGERRVWRKANAVPWGEKTEKNQYLPQEGALVSLWAISSKYTKEKALSLSIIVLKEARTLFL